MPTSATNQRPLVIGGIELTDFSAPEQLVLGVSQMIAVHNFEGGKRTVQEFGPFPPEVIPIKAIWLRDDAEDQNTLLGNYAVTGQEITMTWGPMNYLGVVHRYIPTHKTEHYIEYQLDFIPTIDNNLPNTSPSAGAQGAIGSGFAQMAARWL